MLSFEAALAAAVALVPLLAMAAVSDLKYLRLPNWIALAVLALFVVIAVADILFNPATAMSWGTLLWRLLFAVVALILGFGLFAAGLVGGGDAKLLAAVVPFVAPVDTVAVLVLYGVCALTGVLVVWLISRSAIAKSSGWATWKSVNERGRLNFPWGVALASTMVIYLIWRAVALAPA